MYGGHYTAFAQCERIVHPVLAMEQEVAARETDCFPGVQSSHQSGGSSSTRSMHSLSVDEYICAPYVETSADIAQLAAAATDGSDYEEGLRALDRQWVRFDDEFAIGLPKNLEQSAMHRTIVTGECGRCTCHSLEPTETYMMVVLCIFRGSLSAFLSEASTQRQELPHLPVIVAGMTITDVSNSTQCF